MVKKLLEDNGVERIRLKLKSHRIKLAKQQKEIEYLFIKILFNVL